MNDIEWVQAMFTGGTEMFVDPRAIRSMHEELVAALDHLSMAFVRGLRDGVLTEDMVEQAKYVLQKAGHTPQGA